MTNEEAKIMLLGYMYWHKKGFNQNVFSALCCALEALSEDNQPVKHGEWEQHDGCVLCKDDDTYFYTCSCCKMAITEAERGLFNYCPNCGAKMRGSKILGKEAEFIIDEANAYKREKGEEDD